MRTIAAGCSATFRDENGAVWYCTRKPHGNQQHEAESGYGKVLMSWPSTDPPRTWSLPPEPGPEVTAVRDRRGQLWHRTPSGMQWVEASYAIAIGQFWHEVMRFSPLTDASGEQP